MQNGLLNRKIPTLLGLFLLFIGIGSVIFFSRGTTIFQGRATPADEPKNIRVANITGESVAITFVTETEVLAGVSYGTSPAELLESATEVGAGKSHIIELKNLTPETQYYFKIISGSREYDNNGDPFNITTGSAIGQSPNPGQQIQGKIIRTDGTIASDTLVYLTSPGANVIVTRTGSDGAFSFNTSSLLSDSLNTFFQTDEDTQLNLTALDANSQLTAVFLAGEANPLPTVTLGQNYNFTKTDFQKDASVSAESIGFPVFSERATEAPVVSIETPEPDEGFSDQRPNFEGTSMPNSTVEITIQSDQEIKTSVTSNSAGNWEFRPETPLEPGKHTITIRTRDENGILRIITRPFTVYAQGSQFTEPSVSPSRTSPTPTPTTVVISPTAEPTSAPSITASPSPTMTLAPTQTPIPTVFAVSPTPMPEIKDTGPANIPLVLVSSLAILVSGGLIYLFAKINSL